jgi:hypothetical protein
MAHSTERTAVHGSLADVRSVTFQLKRRRWPGLLAAAVIGAAIAAAAISSYLDGRSLGTQVDASVDAAKTGIDRGAESLRGAAADAALGSAQAASGVVTSLQDTGITAAVKTALAADPQLSAWKIDVDTRDGVVVLAGPAPDARSRDRAEVLASAPQGVLRVDNRLVVSPSPAVVQAMPTSPK